MRRRRKLWADKYDAYGALPGLAVIAACGLAFHAFGGWCAEIALGAGVMNWTSHLFRRANRR